MLHVDKIYPCGEWQFSFTCKYGHLWAPTFLQIAKTIVKKVVKKFVKEIVKKLREKDEKDN